MFRPWSRRGCRARRAARRWRKILFGDCNPSGRLSVTVPRHAGQLPVYYNCKPSKTYWLEHGWGKPYADMDSSPLYEFGYGLSYTEFEYGNLKIEPEASGHRRDRFTSMRISRTRAIAPARKSSSSTSTMSISSVVTPVKELRGFEKIQLRPGEKKTVSFVVTPEHMALLNRHLEWVVEPGTFQVMVGHSSKDIRLTGTFDVASP